MEVQGLVNALVDLKLLLLWLVGTVVIMGALVLLVSSWMGSRHDR